MSLRALAVRCLNSLPRFLRLPIMQWHYVRLLRNFDEKLEPDLMVLRQLLSPGACFVDVGANVGLYTRFASEIVGPGGRVISIEPVPTTFRVLSSVIARLRLSNAKAINCAISDSAGRATMRIPSGADGYPQHYLATISQDEHATGPAVEVVTQTLDALVADLAAEPAFIKIDAEGHELACIRGGLQTIRGFHPVLLVEFSSDPDSPKTDAWQIFRLLADIGYSAWLLHGATLRRRQAGEHSTNYAFLDSAHEAAVLLRQGIEPSAAERDVAQRQ